MVENELQILRDINEKLWSLLVKTTAELVKLDFNAGAWLEAERLKKEQDARLATLQAAEPPVTDERATDSGHDGYVRVVDSHDWLAQWERKDKPTLDLNNLPCPRCGHRDRTSLENEIGYVKYFECDSCSYKWAVRYAECLRCGKETADVSERDLCPSCEAELAASDGAE